MYIVTDSDMHQTFLTKDSKNETGGTDMKDKIFGVLQRVGRSFMLPIAILPVAGLLLGVGGSFTNETMLNTYGLTGIMGPGTVLNAILQVMSAAGDIVFARSEEHTSELQSQR